MAEYYLISQLPSLDAIGENSPIPITQEQFLELCNRFLNKKAVKELENLTLVPSLEQEKTSSELGIAVKRICVLHWQRLVLKK